jgi:hypothetical protein
VAWTCFSEQVEEFAAIEGFVIECDSLAGVTGGVGMDDSSTVGSCLSKKFLQLTIVSVKLFLADIDTRSDSKLGASGKAA